MIRVAEFEVSLSKGPDHFTFMVSDARILQQVEEAGIVWHAPA